MDISITPAGMGAESIVQNAKSIGLNSSYGMVGKVRTEDSLSNPCKCADLTERS